MRIVSDAHQPINLTLKMKPPMFSFKLIIKSTVVLGLAVMASAANASAPALSGLNLVNQPYAEGQGPMVIGDGITVTDPDCVDKKTE